MKQILCLANEAWSSSPGRTQQLVSRLKDAQILYFAPATGRTDRSFLKKGVKVRPNVTAYTLPPPLFSVDERMSRLFRWEQRKLARFIAQTAQRHRFQHSLLWTTNPEHIHLLDQLEYQGLVYDCDREWDELPPAWEGCLANVSDVVFAASPSLCDRLSPCSSNIAVVPNGVNYPLFSGQGTATHSDPLPQISGPIFGWAGTIRQELDLSPLLYAALDRPDWTFVLLGQREGNRLLPKLRRLPNVVLPGQRPLSEVPDWLLRCQVLLDFLRDGVNCDDMISPRMYEYLATGKPVVSMLWPDQVEQFPDVVYAAHTHQEFVTCCSHALEEAAGFVSERRRAHAQGAAWPNRVEQIVHILDTAGLL